MLESPLAVDVLPASGRLPVLLVRVLVCQVAEEIATHVVVIQVGFIPVLPVSNELVRKGIDEQASHGHVLFALPRPHHTTEGNKVVVAGGIPIANSLDLRLGVGSPPLAPVVRVGIGVGATIVVENGHYLECNAILETHDHDLTVRTYTGGRVGPLPRGSNSLKQRSLSVASVLVVLEV